MEHRVAQHIQRIRDIFFIRIAELLEGLQKVGRDIRARKETSRNPRHCP
jgi:hypothetical protein